VSPPQASTQKFCSVTQEQTKEKDQPTTPLVFVHLSPLSAKSYFRVHERERFTKGYKTLRALPQLSLPERDSIGRVTAVVKPFQYPSVTLQLPLLAGFFHRALTIPCKRDKYFVKNEAWRYFSRKGFLGLTFAHTGAH